MIFEIFSREFKERIRATRPLQLRTAENNLHLKNERTCWNNGVPQAQEVLGPDYTATFFNETNVKWKQFECDLKKKPCKLFIICFKGKIWDDDLKT